jgi:hypothetical protein
LINVIAEKYGKEMKKPTILLQSIYRSMKISQLTKHEYFVIHLRQKLIRGIVKVQTVVRKRIKQRQSKYYKLVNTIMNKRENSAVIL